MKMEVDANTNAFEPVQAAFTITVADMRNAARKRLRDSRILLANVGISFLNVGMFAAQIHRYPESYAMFIVVVGVVSALTLITLMPIVAAVIPLVRRTGDVHYRVTIDRAGISGQRNGVPFHFSWSRIGGVTDDGTSLRFNSRRTVVSLLVIPKSALARPEQVWRQLNTLLIAPRGLVRPTAPRSTITNTAMV